MLGPREVAGPIATLLAAHIEAEVTRLAGENDAVTPDTSGAAPLLDAQPALVSATQLDPMKVRIEDWPFLCVVPRSMSGLRRVNVDDEGRTIYVARYPVEVWIYARGDGYEFTAAVRDRLTLACRETLLRRKHLEAAGYALELDEGTLTEDYSPVGVDDDLRATVAAASIRFEVAASSALTPVVGALGVSERFEVATRPGVPEHPAL